MAIASELTELMTDTITVYDTSAYSGSGYGTEQLGTGVAHRAFVQQRQRIARDADGIAVRSDADAYTDSILTELSSADYIAFDGRWYRPVRINIYRDESGPHHTEVGMAQVPNPTS